MNRWIGVALAIALALGTTGASSCGSGGSGTTGAGTTAAPGQHASHHKKRHRKHHHRKHHKPHPRKHPKRRPHKQRPPRHKHKSTPPPASNCDPNYKGACLDPNASDYDCAGGSGNGPKYVQGPITVVGNDHYGLDRDGDGIACE